MSLHLARASSVVSLILATIASLLLSLVSNCSSVYAKTKSLALEMPVYGALVYQNLVNEAEPIVAKTIDRQFIQEPRLEMIEVVITANRDGDVIPVMTTYVSRAQWQQAPQVSLWSKYHRAYAQFQRPDLQPRSRTVVAVALRRSDIQNSLSRNTLSGRAAQRQLSDID